MKTPRTITIHLAWRNEHFAKILKEYERDPSYLQKWFSILWEDRVKWEALESGRIPLLMEFKNELARLWGTWANLQSANGNDTLMEVA